MNTAQSLTETATPQACCHVPKSVLYADAQMASWIGTKYTAAHYAQKAKIAAAGAYCAMSRVI